jgi:kynurenine formamidase
MSESARWAVRPAGSNWGRFGHDDQVGRLNLLTPEKVKQGTAEVQEGRTFCLSLPLDFPGGTALSPRRHPPVLRPTLRDGRVNWNFGFAPAEPRRTDLLCDDAAVLHTHYSTHWDALCHVGQIFDARGEGTSEPVYYNGYRAGTDILGPSDPIDAGATGTFEARTTSAALALGIENMATTCVQGRGVMIDLHKHVGRSRKLVGYEQLMRIMEADDVAVEPGDMVCLHTGFAAMLLEMQREPDAGKLRNSCAALDGRDDKLLDWITESDLVVLAADNFAVEGLPARPAANCCTELPLHRHCLFKLGVHLGELWHLTPLAEWLRAHGRSRFLLTAPPLRLPGASGSPLTPVATV